MSTNAIECPFDVVAVVGEFLADAGILDGIAQSIGRLFAAVPDVVTGLLGPDVRTPANSAPPFVSVTEPGSWSGLIVLQASQPTHWLLMPTGRAAPCRPTPPDEHPPWGRPSPPPWQPRPPPTTGIWAEDEDPYAQWEREQWARGR